MTPIFKAYKLFTHLAQHLTDRADNNTSKEADDLTEHR